MATRKTRTGEWVTIADAAEYLGTCTRTVRRRIADGSLPARRLGAQAIRVNIADVDALLRPIPTVDGAA
jgi:excisionase family DNA binding protein